MTIQKLVDERESIERTISHLSDVIKDVNGTFDKINELEKKAGDEGKQIATLARASVTALIMNINDGKAQLRNYSTLLGDIMRQTELSCPPECLKK